MVCSLCNSATTPLTFTLEFLEVLFPVVGQMVCANSLVALNCELSRPNCADSSTYRHVQVSNTSLNEHNRIQKHLHSKCTPTIIQNVPRNLIFITHLPQTVVTYAVCFFPPNT